MNYNGFFQNKVDELKGQNRYREFLDISRACGSFPMAINNKNNKEITIWCSNDYLGLGQRKEAISSLIESTKKFGIGSGGTRNISGTNNPLVELEKEIASLHKKDRALVFSSGYVANDATITSLAKIIPNLAIFSDEKNHASIISGIKNSGLEKHIFRHNDMEHLEGLLNSVEISRPKIIIFESVYSMDGDFAKVKEITVLAKKYNAMTFIDEVHGVGLYGKNGGGLAQELNLEKEIDIIQGTFAKAFGAIGGYIAASNTIIDAIKSVASGFIFTTAMQPATAAAIVDNVKYVRRSSYLRKEHKEKVIKLKRKLLENNIEIIANESHIIAIIIGDAFLCKKISESLLDKHNIYIQHINYPTVAKGQERLRIIITPLHSDKMIDDLVFALKTSLQQKLALEIK